MKVWIQEAKKKLEDGQPFSVFSEIAEHLQTNSEPLETDEIFTIAKLFYLVDQKAG